MLRVLIERPSVATGDVNSGKKQFHDVSRRYPDVVRKMKITFCGSDEEREKGLASAEVFVAWRFPKENLAMRAPNLKWIQLTGAGVEHLMPLDWLPAGTRAAFEFRHASWLEDPVYRLLESKRIALCVAESEKLSTPVEITADYAYFRLRDEGYTPRDITQWAHTIRDSTAACRDVFVYFKHEESGKGPEFARLLLDALKAA